MAGVAKGLRPRFVVPIYVGSNPTIRPIYKKDYRKIVLFIYDNRLIWVARTTRRSLVRFERERAEGEGTFFGASKACEKKVRRPVKRERPRQSHHPPHLKKDLSNRSFLRWLAFESSSRHFLLIKTNNLANSSN